MVVISYSYQSMLFNMSFATSYDNKDFKIKLFRISFMVCLL